MGRCHVAFCGCVLVFDMVPPAGMTIRIMSQVIMQIYLVNMSFSFMYLKAIDTPEILDKKHCELNANICMLICS